MADFVQNLTFNGVNDFTLITRTYSWSEASFGSVEGYNPNSAVDNYLVNLTAAGSWQLRSLTFGEAVGMTFTDTADGGTRRINFLRLGEDGANITLGAGTRIDYIRGWEFENNFLQLGVGRTSGINLFDGDDTVIGGSGSLGSVNLGGGNNSFTAGTGGTQSVKLEDGNDTVFVGTNAFINSAALGGGDDTVDMTGNGRMNSLEGFGGTKTVNLSGDARIGQVFLGDGDKTINIQDNARIFNMKLDGGTNTVTTGNGFMESIFTYNSNNTITIGAGGAGQLLFTGPNETPLLHTVVANGFVGSIQVFGNARSVLTMNGSSDFIRTNLGNDRISTGSEFIGTIVTRDGNDTVNLGSGGAQYVDLGNGDDTIRVSVMEAFQGVTIQGGSGIDTLDLSRITQSVFVDLSQIGTFQNIGTSAGLTVPGVIGYLSIGGIENLRGTSRADVLTGRDNNNLLQGGNGSDRLSGLGGNDTLVGGKGNDRLFGGSDADVFVFGRREGTDRIMDFELGLDQIQFNGVSRLSQITFADTAAGARLTAIDTVVIVEGLTVAEVRDVDNFLF